MVPAEQWILDFGTKMVRKNMANFFRLILFLSSRSIQEMRFLLQHHQNAEKSVMTENILQENNRTILIQWGKIT